VTQRETQPPADREHVLVLRKNVAEDFADSARRCVGHDLGHQECAQASTSDLVPLSLSNVWPPRSASGLTPVGRKQSAAMYPAHERSCRAQKSNLRHFP
jgi:hypothetical protein